MKKYKTLVEGYTAEQIKQIIDSEPKFKTGMRLYAIYQVSLGVPIRKLEELYQTSFKQIYNWVHRFEDGGVDGLQNKIKPGRPSRLSKNDLSMLKEILLSSTPEAYGYNTALWNGSILIDVVKKEFKVEYKRAQIYNVLKKIGFSFQKGRPSYPEADPELKEEFKEKFKKKRLTESKDTVFLFEDEFSLSNTATVSHGWALKGQQPIVKCIQKCKERQTVFGSVQPKTGKMVISFANRGNYQSFKKHLKKVLWEYREAPKIVMILDNVRFHHARLLKVFLQKHTKLELMYLPAYSPELNPIERAWWFMRKSITHNRFILSLKERKVLFWKMFSHFFCSNEKMKLICAINY